VATIGDLVVNLTANSSSFNRHMSESQAMVRRFGQSSAQASATAASGFNRAEMSLGKMAGAFIAVNAAAAATRATIGGAVSVIKSSITAAARVETLATQFEVLTGNADDSAQLLADISRLAATTPFQKMELADAGRKLLAFGSAAAFIPQQLREIGDIAALTGNDISDLAEIYGKARVQGRLFAVDINQLTGRGIPIIQELAHQFGVTDAEVKKLVSDGQVGFAQLQQAFADMTSEGGKFAGGMERLSETTTGKISTLNDKFEAMRVTIGEQLLPTVERLVDTLDSMFAADGPAMTGLQSFIGGINDLTASMSAFEGGILNPGFNFQKFEQQELQRMQQKQQADVVKANERVNRIVADRKAAMPANPAAAAMAIPGDIPAAIITRVTNDMAEVVKPAIVDGFQDAGRFSALPASAIQPPSVQFAGAAERGSQDAYQVIARNVFGGRQDKQTMELEKQTGELQKISGLLAAKKPAKVVASFT